MQFCPLLKNVLRFLFFNKNAFLKFFKIFLQRFFMNKKNVNNSNVPVSKLCTWNVRRRLVLLLEWCDRTSHFSGLSPVRRSSAYIIASKLRAHTTDSDWHLHFTISFTILTAFALYNHACYNIEILIKLLTFFIQRLQMFLIFFVTFLNVFNVFKF